MGGPSGPPAGLAGLSPAARAALGRALRPGAGAAPGVLRSARGLPMVVLAKPAAGTCPAT